MFLLLLVKSLDAAGAHVFAPEQNDIFGVIAEDTGRLIFTQHDGVTVYIDLQCVLGLNVQCVTQFNGQDDAAQLIHLSNDTG